ncbi:MAG: hypothetical protein ABIY37_15135 [Devosia sp.]
MILIKNATLALTLALALSGCAYDYAQHSDQVAYSAGDAVKANLALQTIDPSKKSMNDTSGLGKNGIMPIVEVVVENPTGGQ